MFCVETWAAAEGAEDQLLEESLAALKENRAIQPS